MRGRWMWGRAVRGVILRGGVAVLAVCGLLLTSGCASVPGSGPVNEGQKLAADSENDLVHFQPDPPQHGASPTAILDGFIAAMVSGANDYQIARQFLTSDFAKRWKPASGVLIDEGARQHVVQEDGSITLQLLPIAQLDSAGVLMPTSPGKRQEMKFKLQQEGGNWRIADAPDGLLLSRAMFTTMWAPNKLYFVGGSGSLVPEVRWFLRRRSATSQAVSALLRGPSEAMEGILHSAFPAGTTLVGGAVPVTDGVASVNLSGGLSQIDGELLSEVRGQITATLLAMERVEKVKIFVDGVAVENLPEGGRAIAKVAAITPSRSSTMFALQGGKFGELVQGRIRDGKNLFQLVADAKPKAITLNSTLHSAAVLGARGVTLVSGANSRVIDERAVLLAPSVDHWDWVWSLANDGSGQILIANVDGSDRYLSVSWLRDKDVVAFKVSPSGSRLTALVREGEGSKVISAGIMRDAFGFPYSVSEHSQLLSWTAGEGVDLDWVNDTTYTILESFHGTSRVLEVGLGEMPVAVGAIQDAVQIVSDGVRGEEIALTSQGKLFRLQDTGWNEVATGISSVASRG